MLVCEAVKLRRGDCWRPWVWAGPETAVASMTDMFAAAAAHAGDDLQAIRRA